MRIVNVHRRQFSADAGRVGRLLDLLGSPDDELWPSPPWPRMWLEGPLAPGVRGGHGPIAYRVESYVPGRALRFRFEAPAGFDGFHEFRVEDLGARGSCLEHRIEMDARGRARLHWALAIAPLHDAVVEDALDCAARALGEMSRGAPWSWRVRAVRALLGRGRRPQPA
jgi:hypothetical protein